MKLPIVELSLSEQLAEFDMWITPSLGDIRDTTRFQNEMATVVQVIETMGSATAEFADAAHCRPAAIAERFVQDIQAITEAEAQVRLTALASVLFLVTGKSDNNAKCQLPIYLRDHAGMDSLPSVRRTGAQVQLTSIPMPRELKSAKLMTVVAKLRIAPEIQYRLLEQFIAYVLSDDNYISQLWSIGRSYFMLRSYGRERDLLSPLVAFQVRGSVAASGGHDPEEILRAQMVEWGLRPNVDYNTSDLVLTSIPGIVQSPKLPADSNEKTRAYDFILPYQTDGWRPRLFVQCQFYAGDSGSVSHKNVDQTTRSRTAVLSVIDDALFIEYLDGAGYFSSLNGDLRRLMTMTTTYTFTQIRTAAIRLRRALQTVGFLTPLEVSHAILRSDGSRSEIFNILDGEGYSHTEIRRCLSSSLNIGFAIQSSPDLLDVHTSKRSISRRYFMLDVAARDGATLTPDKCLGDYLMVPGYGPYYGIAIDNLLSNIFDEAPQLRHDWSNPETVTEDIRWLCERGMVLAR